MRALGKRPARAVTASISSLAAQHAALELEVVEAVALMGRLGQPHDRLGRQRLLVAQPEPVVAGAPAPSA